MRPVNSFMRDLRSISFQGKPSDDLDPTNTLIAAGELLEPEVRSSIAHGFPTHRNFEIIHV